MDVDEIRNRVKQIMQGHKQDDDLFVDFMCEVSSRMAIGREQYGNLAFKDKNLYAELSQELFDLVVYTYFMWLTLQSIAIKHVLGDNREEPS